MFALQKHLRSFEQHYKQFANDRDSSKCPPPAFTHAFTLLVNFFNSLVDGKFSPITYSTCFSVLVRNCQ